MAVRIAQDLGLMLETSTQMPPADREERRRVFWSVYLLDRLVSCGRGRPPAIVDACCHLQLPCEEHMWREGLTQQTLTLDEIADRGFRSPQRQGAFAHVIVMAFTVGRTAQYMLQEFNIRSRRPPWDSSSDFAAIESDLLYLESRLELDRPVADTLAPHLFQGAGPDYQSSASHIFSRALFHLCYCMLAHPFLLRRRLDLGQIFPPSSFLARIFDTGWQHARKMVELFQEANNHGCSFRSSFGGYCVLIAGSIAALHAHSDNPSTRSQASGVLQTAIIYLQDAGRYWRNVSTMVSSYVPVLRDGGGLTDAQALTLQQTAEDTLTYSQLATQSPRIPALSPEHAEAMWSLVDYSTISNEGSLQSTVSQPSSTNMWFESWVDLFGMSNNMGDFTGDGSFVGDFPEMPPINTFGNL